MKYYWRVKKSLKAKTPAFAGVFVNRDWLRGQDLNL